MQKTKSPQEIEIKLPVLDVPALKNRLKQLHTRKVIPRTFESNTLYDSSGKALARRGQLIRIRIEQPAPKGKQARPIQNPIAILTFKGPVQKLKDSKKVTKSPHNRFKIREELEVTLGGADQMIGILQALGFRPVFRYEKFRTTYALPGIRNVKIEFDETPVGEFLELEGNMGSIDRASRLLGYTQSDYMTRTYGELYIADCRRRGIRPANMIFSSTEQK
jgi:adenylate cyclase class 2